MQAPFIMLTRWAIALQSSELTADYRTGRLNVLPDTLSCLLLFKNSEAQAVSMLAPLS